MKKESWNTWISQFVVGLILVGVTTWFTNPDLFHSRIKDMTPFLKIFLEMILVSGIIYLVQDNIRNRIKLVNKMKEIDSIERGYGQIVSDLKAEVAELMEQKKTFEMTMKDIDDTRNKKDSDEMAKRIGRI